MISSVLTQVALWLCVVIFVRLFTYQRGTARFRRGISCLATLVMGCSGITILYILQGKLILPPLAWPLIILLLVFAWAVVRAEGNLAGVLRPEPGPSWSGTDRRRAQP